MGDGGEEGGAGRVSSGFARKAFEAGEISRRIPSGVARNEFRAEVDGPSSRGSPRDGRRRRNEPARAIVASRSWIIGMSVTNRYGGWQPSVNRRIVFWISRWAVVGVNIIGWDRAGGRGGGAGFGVIGGGGATRCSSSRVIIADGRSSMISRRGRCRKSRLPVHVP